jgi:hypothetical protein
VPQVQVAVGLGGESSPDRCMFFCR